MTDGQTEAAEQQAAEVCCHDNPDTRNRRGLYGVRVYFNTGREHYFPARDIGNARDIAARVTREGAWIVHADGTEEHFPVHTIHKAKILPPEADND